MVIETRAIFDATFAVIARNGMQGVGLPEIAQEMGCPLSLIEEQFSTVVAVLRAAALAIDKEVEAQAEDSQDFAATVAVTAAVTAAHQETAPEEGPEEGADEGAAERLFEVIMWRFDALEPWRAGIRRLFSDGARAPLWAAPLFFPTLISSMHALLSCAQCVPKGACLRGLAVMLLPLYLSALHVWLDDESSDRGRTMAFLNRHTRKFTRLSLGFAREAGSAS